MKVILVNGSPHKNGCTHRALAEVATTLDAHGIESEIFWIGAKPAAGCMACGRCRETGACIFDDAVNEFRAVPSRRTDSSSARPSTMPMPLAPSWASWTACSTPTAKRARPTY